MMEKDSSLVLCEDKGEENVGKKEKHVCIGEILMKMLRRGYVYITNTVLLLVLHLHFLKDA